MGANFSPEFLNYNNKGSFVFWAQKVIPLVYDNSLSYYETLCKVVSYLNNVIENVETTEENLDALHEAYDELEGYVNNYFDNLDVQAEINNKLDEMAENGYFDTILAEYADEVIPTQVSEWLGEHITPTTPAVDNSLSVSGAAADARVTGERITSAADNTEELLKAGYIEQDFVPPITIGSTIINGQPSSNPKRARTGLLLGGARRRIIELTGDIYTVWMLEYGNGQLVTSNFIGTLHSTGSSGILSIPQDVAKIVMVFSRRDGANMTSSDATSIQNALKSYRKTDDSLTLKNESADSYVTGNRIEAVTDALMKKEVFGDRYTLVNRSSIVNGEAVANNARVRTGMILNRTNAIELPDAYECFVGGYDETGRTSDGQGYTGTLVTAWATGRIAIPRTAYKFIIVFKRADDANITDDDIAAIRASVYTYKACDYDLVTAGMAADAEATGKAIENVRTAIENVRTTSGITTKRNNTYYVGQILDMGETYLNKGLVYGQTTILDQSATTRAIDCSTFVGLLLRGLSYNDTSYGTNVSTDPNSYVANPNVAWSINPFDYEYKKAESDATASKVRTASQLAEWMVERGERVPIDTHLANILPGDIVFFAKKNSDTDEWVQPDRFMHISHVGIVATKTSAPVDATWDTTKYPYEHDIMDAGGRTGAIGFNVLEKDDSVPDYYSINVATMVLVCRPDLGTI